MKVSLDIRAQPLALESAIYHYGFGTCTEEHCSFVVILKSRSVNEAGRNYDFLSITTFWLTPAFNKQMKRFGLEEITY